MSERSVNINKAFEFVADLPEKAKRQGRGGGVSEYWASVSKALRENEGRWAQVCDFPGHQQAAGMASRIRKGTATAFNPAGHFESTHRPLDDGRWGTFARYTGQAADLEDETDDRDYEDE